MLTFANLREYERGLIQSNDQIKSPLHGESSEYATLMQPSKGKKAPN